MAKSESLPIFLDTYRFTLELYKSISKMTREHKYTIGIDIKHDAMDLLRQIYKANHHRDKAPYLDDFLAVLELIKLQLRICHDINALSLRKIVQLALMLDKVAKQATAWKKHSIKQLRKEVKKEELNQEQKDGIADAGILDNNALWDTIT